MKINCKEITIEDGEIGCSVSFYEKIQGDSFDYSKEFTITEVMESMGPYISLHRTYAEDDFESDYQYIECSEFEQSDELAGFKADLFSNRFLIELNNEVHEINFDITAEKYAELKNGLMKTLYYKGQFIIH